MRTFRTYRDLLESDLADKFIFEMIVSRRALPFLASVWFWCYMDDLFLFLLPLFAFHCRHWISNLWIRRILTCSIFAFSWFFRSWFWIGLILSTELARFALIYGVPFFLRRVSEEMPRDPVGETALKKSIRLLRRLRSQGMTQSVNEYLTIYSQYRQGNRSEPFNQEERSQFEQFFRDFGKTTIVVGGDRITLFFPSFIVRLGSAGIDFDSASTMKLTEGPQTEQCPICQESLSDPGVELSCHHRYCLDCILPWFDQKTDCPLCRQPLS